MNPAEGLLLYSPVVYWVAIVLLLYRHDLSRLRHPFKDQGGARNWWPVLDHLDLLSTGQADRLPSRRRQLIPYVVCIAASLLASLSWNLKIFPPTWYFLVIVQGIATIVLTAATMQYLGTPPRRPFVDALRYPRLGSRVKHLAMLGAKDKQKAGEAGTKGQEKGQQRAQPSEAAQENPS